MAHGIIKRIHINQHKIKSNSKHGADEPVITCKTSKENVYGRMVEIYHEDQVVATIKYEPNKPLSCGAKVWVETTNHCVVWDSENQYQEV
jgi:hypothetical protein